MMNMKRVVVLSKSVQLGKQLLVSHARNAGKDVAKVYQQRSIKTHSRNLAYAKDLFLGQVNKVNERIHLEHRHEEWPDGDDGDVLGLGRVPLSKI